MLSQEVLFVSSKAHIDLLQRHHDVKVEVVECLIYLSNLLKRLDMLVFQLLLLLSMGLVIFDMLQELFMELCNGVIIITLKGSLKKLLFQYVEGCLHFDHPPKVFLLIELGGTRGTCKIREGEKNLVREN